MMNLLKRNTKVGPSGVSNQARCALAIWMPAALLLCAISIPSRAGSPADVPSISAGLGTCSADFTVVDSASKPIYNAKVHVKVQYGFMSKRNTDLEVGTNARAAQQTEEAAT
jgi:hypothetical protein